MPSPDSIGKAYEAYYTHASRLPQERGFRAVMRACERSYRRWQYASRRTALDLIGALPILAMPSRRRRVDAQMRFLPRASGKLFDLGCGSGDFLAIARAVGWEVSGSDFDQAAVDTARAHGLSVSLAGAEALAGRENEFDVITVNSVIEHLFDPLGALEMCFRALKPGGLIWLDTPNLEARGHALFGRYWRGLESPRHLILFTRESLGGLLKKAGFVSVEDGPYRELCEWSFLVSDGLACENGGESPVQFEIAQGERLARREPRERELLSLSARKP